MSIDWITVAAQIVNFLVLIWLLKRFLYRPILDGITAREAEIATRMGEADMVRKQSEAREAELKAQIADLSASRAEVLETARREAEKERSELIASAQERVRKEQAERDARRTDEAQRFSADLHRSGAEALLALTRKALADLADETLEHRIVMHAVTQVKSMQTELRAASGDASKCSVLTRDPIPDTLKAKLREELAPVLGDLPLTFEEDASLPFGLTLRIGGAQVGWTIDSYLNGLDAALDARIKQTASKGMTHAA
ncbi:F0F1 ATP synthase subunit B [Marivita sp. S0852]|uniref:F0F1 ATP synthase subunit B family protein n=1 Tax=Marivita sp. S0852 TaxID=3373893 RepID=UPI0039821846